MVNCKYCGGENLENNKFCQYCGREINSTGKDYSNGGNAFLITDIFKVSNRAMVIGKPLQYINVGDILYFGKNAYKVWNMQRGQSIVDNATPNDAQIGIAFVDYNIKDLKKGVTLTFNRSE